MPVACVDFDKAKKFVKNIIHRSPFILRVWYFGEGIPEAFLKYGIEFGAFLGYGFGAILGVVLSYYINQLLGLQHGEYLNIIHVFLAITFGLPVAFLGTILGGFLGAIIVNLGATLAYLLRRIWKKTQEKFSNSKEFVNGMYVSVVKEINVF